jgi:hypothetical protein
MFLQGRTCTFRRRGHRATLSSKRIYNHSRWARLLARFGALRRFNQIAAANEDTARDDFEADPKISACWAKAAMKRKTEPPRYQHLPDIAATREVLVLAEANG